MKYEPGNYSVTLFSSVGTKLETLHRDHDSAALTSLHQATVLAEKSLDEIKYAKTYVIQRVITNSAIKKSAA